MKDGQGEVCHANWREGEKSIRGDPITELDHLSAVDGQHENGKVNDTKRAHVTSRGQDDRGGGESYGPLDAGHGWLIDWT
jgi:hypothetical protein